MRNPHFVRSVDFYDDDDERPKYCKPCLDRGYYHKLGAKIVDREHPRQPDWDKWLMCYECGDISPKNKAKYEQSLEGFAEPSDDPFDDQTVVESVPRRSTAAGKKSADKRNREKNRAHHKDSEIDDAIRQFGEENVKIVYDSDP